jgi:2-phospho-L-lactate guanylyltransferase
MSTTAVIPIKQLEDAKQRLSGLLNSNERKLLFQAMVNDVLTAVEACTYIDSIVVVTNDQAVAELARGFGAEIRTEPEPPGLIEAVTETGKQLAAEGVECMLFLPGDVPLVTPAELEVVLEGFGMSGQPEFMIVPASDLGGSNCVACSPPDCMSFGFGIDSFRKHLVLARDHGIDPQVTKLPGIGLDIDTPSDISELMAEIELSREGQGARSGYSTARLLEEIGIRQRLQEKSANIV